MVTYCDSALEELKNKIINFSEEDDSGCWNWNKGYRDKAGYGQLKYRGKVIGAHRASYLAFNGHIDPELYVCHSCDNPKCVNPEHLWQGTAKDNMQDCKAKGRLADQRGKKLSPETLAKLKLNRIKDAKGMRNPRAKLTDNDIRQIRGMNKNGYTHAQIAKEYGVNESHVSHINCRKAWSHIID